MKKLFLLLLAGSCGLMVWAQTNVPVNAPAAAAAKKNIGWSFDQLRYSGTDTRQVICTGNVVVTNLQGKLTCGQLTFDLPPENSKDTRPTNVVAETNVVIDYIKISVKEEAKYVVEDGKTNRVPYYVTNHIPYHITSDRMTNNYSILNGVTNDTFTFSGHARMTDGKGSLAGEPMIYDNVTGGFSAVNATGFGNLPANSNQSTNASPLDILKF